ncbi:MAG: glycosyltransferase family 39 protein [Acidobacteria bacterium]|nr:glycosyltransferase family 39 protein [Acidobacteriota bacterium]
MTRLRSAGLSPFARLTRFPLLAAWLVAGAALLAFSSWALDYATRYAPSFGAHVRIYEGVDAESAVRMKTFTTDGFDPMALARRAGLDPRATYRIEYDGQLFLRESGTYVIEGRYDDALRIEIDKAPIHDIRRAPGAAESHPPPGIFRMREYPRLERGLHPIRVTYWQLGGDAQLELTIHEPRNRNVSYPLTILASEAEPVLLRHLEKADTYPLFVATLWSAWLLCGLALITIRVAEFTAGGSIATLVGWRSLLPVLAVAAVLLPISADIGLWPGRGWGPDELSPKDVLFAMQTRFGREWYHLYPPGHFYLLSLITAPFALIDSVARAMDDTALHRIHLIARWTSVTLALLTLVTTALIAARTLGRRHATIAALCVLGPCFVYYSRTTNVDMAYLSWAWMALLAMVSCVQRPSYAAHVLLGLFTALSVGSKDQAYAIFPGIALTLIVVAWRRARQHRMSFSNWMAGVSPRHFAAGAATFVIAYVMVLGVPWNAAGVRAHFDLVTGQGSTPFRMFDRSASGMALMGVTVASLLPPALGPAVLVLAIIGLGYVASSPRAYRALGLFALPALCYLAGFIGVVGYVYDRFLLPLALPAALLAAVAIVRIRDVVASRINPALLIVAVALTILGPDVELTWRQVHDSRLLAETWMREHLTDDPYVLGVGSPLYLPSLFGFRHAYEFSTQSGAILAWKANVLVVNDAWIERYGPTPADATRRAFIAAGYEPVMTTLPRDSTNRVVSLLALGARTSELYSNLEKVSPRLTVWKLK